MPVNELTVVPHGCDAVGRLLERRHDGHAGREPGQDLAVGLLVDALGIHAVEGAESGRFGHRLRV